MLEKLLRLVRTKLIQRENERICLPSFCSEQKRNQNTKHTYKWFWVNIPSLNDFEVPGLLF